MVDPALVLLRAERVGEVAGAVAEQDLLQPRVVERHALARELLARQAAQALQLAAVVVADEAAVQVLVDVDRPTSTRGRA